MKLKGGLENDEDDKHHGIIVSIIEMLLLIILIAIQVLRACINYTLVRKCFDDSEFQ